MTREEAIKILAEIQTKHKKYIGQTECNNALNMAIEALEQEPVVRCKDCIHGEKMIRPWADGRQIVFCWKHGKERFVTSDGHCECGERVKE